MTGRVLHSFVGCFDVCWKSFTVLFILILKTVVFDVQYVDNSTPDYDGIDSIAHDIFLRGVRYRIYEVCEFSSHHVVLFSMLIGTL